MEALAECKSTLLSLLLPLWTPVLQAQNSQVNLLSIICLSIESVILIPLKTQLPVHLQVRLQGCVEGYMMNNTVLSGVHGAMSLSEGFEPNLEGWLLRWLQKLQFKMGQIEIQSSAASQFYNV